jgi:hypothetical protein
MLIRFKATGAVMQVQNQVGRGFIAGGLAVEEKDPTAPGAVPAAPPKWEVITLAAVDRQFLAIRLEVLGRIEYYSGAPNAISPKTFGGHQAPAEIVREYAELWRASPSLRDAKAGTPNTPPGFSTGWPSNKTQAADLQAANDELATATAARKAGIQ